MSCRARRRRFVLENSGVAEPQNIRDKFNEAIADGNPLMQRLHLDTLVTIVDAGTTLDPRILKPQILARAPVRRLHLDTLVTIVDAGAPLLPLQTGVDSGLACNSLGAAHTGGLGTPYWPQLPCYRLPPL